MNTEILREELIRLVKRHDWGYQRSDDRGVYLAGQESANQIGRLVKLLPDGIAVHDAHAPAYYRIGGAS